MQNNEKLQKIIDSAISNTLYNPIYSKIPSFIEVPIIWGMTNKQLNNYYQKPDINLTDKTKSELNKKNNMRHIVGLGNTTKVYGAKKAKYIGYTKELADLTKNYLDNGKITQDAWKDTLIDLNNNNLGIEYIKNNPIASNQDLMDFAYKQPSDYDNNNLKYNSRLFDFIKQNFVE